LGEIREGASKCSGKSIRVDRLERIVLTEMSRHLMSSAWLQPVVEQMIAAVKRPDDEQASGARVRADRNADELEKNM
jgi:hypothetical protein